MTNPTNNEQEICQTSALMASTEIFLGSILHGFKLPFGGSFLSLVQLSFLCRLSKITRHLQGSLFNPYYSSSISACLKSLSPAGNKLGPMLSIWMQGVLFNGGILIGGRNRIGFLIGGILLSLWAFIQPIVTLYLFFGNTLIEVMGFYTDKLESKLGLSGELLLWVFGAIVLFKILLASIIVLFFSQKFSHYIDINAQKILNQSHKKLSDKMTQKSSQPTWLLALKDMTKPLFLISFILGFIFFYFQVSSYAKAIWLSLRPLSIAFIFFWISRSHWFKTWIFAGEHTSKFKQYLMKTLQSLGLNKN